MKYLLLLLLVSCAQYEPKTYVQTTRYHVIGVKCAPGYYYSYDTKHCKPEHYINAEDNPSGVSIDRVNTVQSSPERQIRANERVLVKINTKTSVKVKTDLKPNKRLSCEAVFKEMNRCMQ